MCVRQYWWGYGQGGSHCVVTDIAKRWLKDSDLLLMLLLLQCVGVPLMVCVCVCIGERKVGRESI